VDKKFKSNINIGTHKGAAIANVMIELTKNFFGDRCIGLETDCFKYLAKPGVLLRFV